MYNRVSEDIAEQKAVRGKKGKSLSFALSPAWQRRGLMYEAVSAVLEQLFREENTDYVHCGYLSYNLPSKALQEKLGFHWLVTERFEFEGREVESVENILWKEGYQYQRGC